MNLDQQITDFVNAWALGDQDSLDRILRTIPDPQMDEFLLQTSTRTGVEAGVEPSSDRVEKSLRASGLSGDDAELLSILSTGSFGDWVRAQLRLRGEGAATIAEQLQASAPELDDLELDIATVWLEEIAAGNRASSELTDEAVEAICRALDATPRMIRSLVERDRD